jgi:quercetin dioxygenase-like cupin family protein
MQSIRRIFVGLIFLAMLVAAPFSFTATAQDTATPDGVIPEPTGEVVREVLGSVEPESAPGEIYELARYTIPAGAVLPVHTHPGIQMATVESGTLTYHVVADGEVAITRADGTEDTGVPGDTITFDVGDSWVEPEGMVHWAENRTDEPVILLAASLLEEGGPTSEIVDLEATPATPAT